MIRVILDHSAIHSYVVDSSPAVGEMVVAVLEEGERIAVPAVSLLAASAGMRGDLRAKLELLLGLDQVVTIGLQAADVMIATETAHTFGVDPQLVLAVLETKRRTNAYLLSADGAAVRAMIGEKDLPWLIDIEE